MKAQDAAERMQMARYAQHAWRALPAHERCRRLGSLPREIALNCEDISRVIAEEAGKPLLDALSGDVMVTLEQMRYDQSHAGRVLKSHRIGKPAFFWRGTRFEEVREPHGVVLVFAPSNYPFQLSLVPAFTALVAGNAVVLKCSEHCPQTARLIDELCQKAGLPVNLMQVLHVGPDESRALIEARPDMIFFTGSSESGRAIAAQAAHHLIPVILELGGKDASLIFADCNLERAVEGVTYGAFSNSGRVCVGIKRAYIEDSIFDMFLQRLVKRTGKLRIGAGKDADICPVEGTTQSRLHSQIRQALARGALAHWPLEFDPSGTKPVVLSQVPDDARLLIDETFGPVLCVAPFKSEAEALWLANSCPFALSSSVWTGDLARGRRIAMQMSAGSCAVNDVIRNIANPHAAFGGNRQSGYGRYHGLDGLRAFSRAKTIMMMSDKKNTEKNWFPLAVSTGKQLAALLRFRHGSKGVTRLLSRWLLPVAFALLLPTGTSWAQAHNPSLAIEVTLCCHEHGAIGYLVFASKDGFPGDAVKALRRGFVPTPKAASQVHIDAGNLPPGRYAVSVYQDVNGNHKLDHNFLGIPKEPVGVSNNPRPRMGPPDFAESSFELSADKTISIVLMR